MDKALETKGRWFLKSRWPDLAEMETDRKNGVEIPRMQKPAETDHLVDLPSTEELCRTFGHDISLSTAMAARESRRKFTEAQLSLEELAYLLWAIQGVRKQNKKVTFRTVPSGGARQPFETYLAVQRVAHLKPGLYRYLPLDHQLVFIKAAEEYGNADGDSYEEILDAALLKHNFHGAVTFIWAALPYRSEWAYATEAARLVLLDAGHVCQNLYLACEAVGCGTCAVGAYDQELTDRFICVDGTKEFAVYAAPVGKLPGKTGATLNVGDP